MAKGWRRADLCLHLLLDNFLLGFSYNTEYGDIALLRNNGGVYRVTQRYIPEDSILLTKSYILI
jgi:hypothetical protein